MVKNTFCRKIDAISRVILYVLNHANNPEIARIGNFSVIPNINGMVARDGMSIISVDKNNGASLTVYAYNTQIRQFIPYFYYLRPTDIPEAINLLEGYKKDYLFLANSLNLSDHDEDHTSGNVFTTFCDESMNLEWPRPQLKIYDRYGNFQCLNTIIDGCVFTAKFFKYVRCPGVFWLPFLPKQSSLYVPPYTSHEHTLCVTTDPILWTQNQDFGLLTLSEKLVERELAILNNYNVTMVWHYDPQCPERNKTELADILRVLRVKRDLKIAIDTSRKHINSVNGAYGHIVDSLPDRWLSTDDLVKEAEKFGLSTDFMSEKTYLISLDDNGKTDSLLPFFWLNGLATAFYGEPQKILFSLIEAFTGKTAYPEIINKKIMLLVPGNYVIRAQRKYSGFPNLTLVDAAILEKNDLLENQLDDTQPEVVIFTESQEIKEKTLLAAMDRCLRRKIALATVSDGPPSPEVKELCDQAYYVKNYFAKDMATNEIKKYEFVEGKVISSTSSEDEIMKG